MSRTKAAFQTNIFVRYRIRNKTQERIFRMWSIDEVLDYFQNITNPTLEILYIGMGGDFSRCRIKEDKVITLTEETRKRGRPRKLAT